MKKLLAILGFLLFCSSAVSADCRGSIPEYVKIGGQGMVLTEEAEEVLCRDDSVLEKWNGVVPAGGQKVLVEDRLVSSVDARRALVNGVNIEFARCVFSEEFYVEGVVSGKVLFRQTEFRGNVDFHSAKLAGELQFVSSVFHQGFHMADSALSEPLVVSGSVMAGGMEIERTLLAGGLRISGSRIYGDFNAAGLRSPVGVTFEDVRFVGSFSASQPEIVGGIRFRGCEWDRSALISLSDGTVNGGVRFDTCSFDAGWLKGPASDLPLIRLSDITIGSYVILATSTSGKFPRMKISRCVVPFLKLPEWRIARGMVLRDKDSYVDKREMEETGELLQLVRSSYESQGRTRDAAAVRNEHRLLVARIKDGPVLWIRLARNYFGTGLWWFIGVIGSFSILLAIMGEKWAIYEKGSTRLARAYRVLDLSIGGFFKGPPKDHGGGTVLSPEAQTALIIERFIGIVFFFLFGIVLNEWIQG